MDQHILEIRRRDMSGQHCPGCYESKLIPLQSLREDLVYCERCELALPRWLTKSELVHALIKLNEHTEQEGEGSEIAESSS